MPLRKTKHTPQSKVRISPPALMRLEFAKGDSTDERKKWGDVNMDFGIGLSRLSFESVSVELHIGIKGLADIKAVYQAIFTLDLPKGKSKNEDVERELLNVVMNLAPQTLYPFVRETLATTASKANLPALILPLVNFRALFDENAIAIPSLEVEEAEEDSQKVAQAETDQNTLLKL